MLHTVCFPFCRTENRISLINSMRYCCVITRSKMTSNNLVSAENVTLVDELLRIASLPRDDHHTVLAHYRLDLQWEWWKIIIIMSGGNAIIITRISSYFIFNL